MKGFQASVGKEVDGAKAAFGKLGSAATSAAKVALTGMVAVKGAVLAVGGAALASYADYEQLTGGVDKLFGSASDQLQKYALEAYRTSGMSANRYMEQATSFSASLIKSLGGDTAKAADYANLAMTTMADNVNVFGSNMEDVQNAFQGFAKQNYTMLDNLKLGYGGTQAEMKRLIKDANELPGVMRDGADLTIDSYADVIEAIARVQQAQGIMGTTAKEAAQTVSGSIGMMKAAWENWLTALGSDDLDLGDMTKRLVDSVTTAIENVIPRAVEIMGTLGAALAEEMPRVAKHIGISLLNALPPEVGNALTSAIALWEAEDMISEKVHLLVAFMKAKLAETLPTAFGEAGTAAATALGNALDAVDGIVSAVSRAFGVLSQAAVDLAPNILGVVAALAALKAVRDAGTAIATVAPGLMSTARSAQFFVTQFAGIARMKGVSGALSALKTNLTATGGALSGLMSPVGAAVAAVAALAAAFAYFYTTNDGFRETVNSIGSVMMSLLKPALDSIGSTLISLGSSVIPAVQQAMAAIAPVIMQILTVIAQVIAVVVPFVAQIVATVLPVITTIISTLVQLGTTIITAVMPVVQSIMTVVMTAMPAILAVVTTVLNAIMAVFSFVWPAIQAVVQTVMGVIQGVITTVWPVIQGVIDTVMGAINSIITAVMQIIQGDWEGAWNTISSFLSGAWDGIRNAVSTGIDNVVNFFANLPGNILGALGDLGGLLIDAGRSIIDGLWSGLKSAWNNVSSWLGDITSMIPDLKGPLPVDAKLLVTNGEAIMGGLLTGLGEGWDDVESYLSSRTGRIPSALAADGVAGARGAVLGRGGDVSNNIYIDGAKLDASPQIEQAISMLVGALTQQYDMGIA